MENIDINNNNDVSVIDLSVYIFCIIKKKGKFK